MSFGNHVTNDGVGVGLKEVARRYYRASEFFEHHDNTMLVHRLEVKTVGSPRFGFFTAVLRKFNLKR